MVEGENMIRLDEIFGFINKQTKTYYVGEFSFNKKLNSFASLDKATSSDLSFCKFKGQKALEMIISSNAGLIICRETLEPNFWMWINDRDADSSSKNLIVVDNPRLWFIKVVREFFMPRQPPEIHPSAVINYDCVEIGKNVRIGPNCTIGFEGFGFEENEEGSYERFPHIGKVILGDYVEVGGNTCIDRGALEDTMIGEGTKIDNLVHIAHNVKIGKNCLIVALTCIGGGVEIGDGAYLGIGCSNRNQIRIGEKAFIGMGAVVVKDVDPGVTVIGNPAKPMKR